MYTHINIYTHIIYVCCSLKAAAPWFSFCLAARKARASSSLVWVAWETLGGTTRLTPLV